ncbi:MAG: hypothetical protein D6741_10535 [Planctomycetota bacterium]|nr:MAG: hypothetical protein D6741_10535 [Planctomycetota bacterium]
MCIGENRHEKIILDIFLPRQTALLMFHRADFSCSSDHEDILIRLRANPAFAVGIRICHMIPTTYD